MTTTQTSKSKRGLVLAFTTLTALLLVVIAVSFCLGNYSVPVGQVANILFGTVFHQPVDAPAAAVTVIWQIRLPRIIAAILIGGALSVAGSTYQGIFKNPMVSPDLLGASAGAGFGAALGLLFGLSMIEVSTLAFAIGIAAVFLAYGISLVINRRSHDLLVLVLTGIVVSSLFTACTSFVKYSADPNSKLPAISFWLMGGLGAITNTNLLYLCVPIIVGMVPIFLLRWKLNLLAFDEDEAKSMGVPVSTYRVIFIVCATLMTAVSVAFGGVIGWIGLLVPHVSRIIVGPNQKYAIPASLLIGAGLLILFDDVARCLFATEIPLGIVTAIIGAPVFIVVLFSSRRRLTY